MGIDIDSLEALAKAAPAGKWETWTSCSWRRVMADDGGVTHRVIEPTYHPADNWPDLLFGEGVREFVEAAQPSTILALIDEVRSLRAAVDAGAADRRRLDSGCLVMQERNEFGEEYQCEHRGLNLRAAIDAAQRCSLGLAAGDSACRPAVDDAAGQHPEEDQVTLTAVGIAYGFLWHIVHPDVLGPTESVVDPYVASRAARYELLEVLTKAERASGISAARIRLCGLTPIAIAGDCVTAVTTRGSGDTWPRLVPNDIQAAADCWCETCRPVTLGDMRMVLCPDCGNKRCPRATDHRNACTNSNEAGQAGSSWEGVKPITARQQDTEPGDPA
ncbi:hypothetical protein [Burkholderia cepacia]|uniref:hypothetical protein n=1 Tax=Burkholderia cepacia TaxID=292 RepID=UPI002AB7B890|nr:hypothetical protein [Burkholderia cepacia]